jgi:hypothetical protein
VAALQWDGPSGKIIFYSSTILAFVFLIVSEQRYGLGGRDFGAGVGMILTALAMCPYP